MCGFVAVYSNTGRPTDGLLKVATSLLVHRGPDDEGYYFSPWFSAGFRRLKIIDLSDRGRQPMADESGRYRIVFNGELYNYREIREELRGLGWRFRSETDTEVLLKAFIQWGEDCLARFNGMFAFLIWDEQEHALFGARDRFGEKPLFYTRRADDIYFASEIKALFPLLGRPPSCRPRVVRQYIQNGIADCSSDTFFQGVYSVPPAHRMAVRGGVVRIARYWQLQETDSYRGDPVEAVRALLLDSIRLRTRSDVPVGTCLSGGLDSGSIVCALSHLLRTTDGQITRKTFTAAYPEYDEDRYVAILNKHSGSEAHSIRPEPAGFADIERLLWYHDEPFYSMSTFASYEVMRLARRNDIVVLLNGQGADEVLAGYGNYYPFYLAQLVREGRLRSALASIKEGAQRAGRSPVAVVLEALKLSLPHNLYARASETVKRWFGRTERPPYYWSLHPDFLAVADQDETVRPQSHMQDALKRALHLSTLAANLPLYLRIEDRNSMANSIENRLPFLDHRLAELLFSLPSRWFMQQGANKYLLREAARGLLPESVRTRKEKFGFGVPQSKWIYDVLGDDVSELITSTDFEQSGVFDAGALASHFREDRAVRRPGSATFWFRVVCFELWRRMQRDCEVHTHS